MVKEECYDIGREIWDIIAVLDEASGNVEEAILYGMDASKEGRLKEHLYVELATLDMKKAVGFLDNKLKHNTDAMQKAAPALNNAWNSMHEHRDYRRAAQLIQDAVVPHMIDVLISEVIACQCGEWKRGKWLPESGRFANGGEPEAKTILAGLG